jgi:hypothetical protein
VESAREGGVAVTSLQEQPADEARVKPRGLPWTKIVGALALVVILLCVLTLCAVSALQVAVPRNMPFGVTGASPVVTAAESQKISGHQVSFVNTLYANQSDAINAINQAKLYGAYIVGTNSDTLLTVPAKSFDALTEVEPLFVQAAAKQHRLLHVQNVKPLPADKDPVGAVVGLLLLPTVIGGLLAAILIYKATAAARQHWRAAFLLGYALFGALLTDLIGGPLLGAYASNRFWPLLPCFLLVTFTVAVVTAGLLAVVKRGAAVLALLLFVVLGLSASGSIGSALMPTYWQAISAALPTHYAVNLYQNVLYFSSNNITTPIVVLAVWALIAIVVLGYVEWLRPRAASAPPAQGEGSAQGPTRRALTLKLIVAVFLIVGLEQCLFAITYTSSAHNPVAHKLPFAATGSSSLLSAAEKNISLRVTTYSNESDAKNAINQNKAWGALIAGSGTPTGTPDTLLTVPTASDLAPLDLPLQFAKAAKSQKQTFEVTPYAPTPLPSGDPFGYVLAIVLTPLLIGGYLSATVLRMALGTPPPRLEGAILLGAAVVATLLVNLIVEPWLHGYPASKFWIVWPIMILIMVVPALFAAVMQRLLGAIGTLLTVVVIILLGKPSSGGANGVAYLPSFWTTLGPFLPPRNAYILLRNTIYFDGNGISQALIILLAYLIVFAVILAILEYWPRPAPEIPITRETETEAAAVAVPAGVT